MADIGNQIAQWMSTALGLDAGTILAILKIIGINIVLSGDNAVVIALACRGLPPKQRTYGILLGAGAAVVLRVIFTVAVTYLLNIPFLKLVGGLALFWIAIKLLMQEEADEDSIKAGGSLWEAVKIVAIADIVMSLDNVLAIAAAAGGNTNLVILGLIISIPLVVFGATLVMSFLTRFPILVWAGAALLGWVAGELIATEPFLQPMVEQLSAMLGVSTKFIARAFEVIGAAIVIGAGLLLGKKSHGHSKAAAE